MFWPQENPSRPLAKPRATRATWTEGGGWHSAPPGFGMDLRHLDSDPALPTPSREPQLAVLRGRRHGWRAQRPSRHTPFAAGTVLDLCPESWWICPPQPLATQRNPWATCRLPGLHLGWGTSQQHQPSAHHVAVSRTRLPGRCQQCGRRQRGVGAADTTLGPNAATHDHPK